MLWRDSVRNRQGISGCMVSAQRSLEFFGFHPKNRDDVKERNRDDINEKDGDDVNGENGDEVVKESVVQREV